MSGPKGIIFNQVNILDQLGEVELIPSSYGQRLTLYLSFRRNELLPPSPHPYSLPKPNSGMHRAVATTTTAPAAGFNGEPGHKEVSLDQEGGWNSSPCPLQKGQPVQRGTLGHSTAVGLAAFSSSSRGLGAVAKDYLERTPMLYEEFLTKGLSQLINEDEGPDLRHILVRHALLLRFFGPSLGSRSGLLARGNPSTGISESLSILRQAGRDYTLSIYIDPAS
ncbi:hypothetical protein ACOSP7_004663 [Xanthoceras sorbifolium]